MKDKTTAGIFAILLGELGVHWFYLGKTGRGLLYLLLFVLLFWTTIVPIIIAIICLVEGIKFLSEDENTFNMKYNESTSLPLTNPHYQQQHPQQLTEQQNNASTSTNNNAESEIKKSKTDCLLELKKLLDNGILTQEEFDEEKKKILNSEINGDN